MSAVRVLRRAGGTFGLAAALTLTSTLAMEPFAAAAPVAVKYHKAPKEKQVPNTAVAVNHRALGQSMAGGLRPNHGWPSAATASVTLPANKTAVAAGLTHLSVANLADGSARSLQVAWLPESASQAAGVPGPMFTLTGDLSAGTNVRLDYSSFANLGGANWGSRLHIVSLPACVLTTPQLAKCQIATPVATINSGSGTLTATTTAVAPNAPASGSTVGPAASGAHSTGGVAQAAPAAYSLKATSGVPTAATAGSTQVYATTTGTSGSNGSFTATSLAPSGSWSVGGNTGAFTYSYPLTTPPPGTGADVAPQVALAYNSASVDGQITTTNNQSSNVGEGWAYDPGYVERTYRTCADVITGGTQDQCWAGNVVTLHLPNGPTESLVRDDATGKWHLQNDNGDTVTYCSTQNTTAPCISSLNNGAWNNEYWVVTTKSGIKYTFGRNVLPGGSTTNESSSVWTTRVYGAHSGDTCYNTAGFASSKCDNMAWRWNLDLVEDPHHNAAAYYYTPEYNYYGPNSTTTPLQYVRGGYLSHIDYGLNDASGSIYGITAPAKVAFTVSERCIPSGTITCSDAQFTTANAAYWPDTPVDLNCASTGTCNTHSPTYWSRKRYTTIATQYLSGSTYKTVDSYTLGQSFPNTGDPEMALNTIVRTATGTDGSTITAPTVTFGYTELDSRVSGYNTLPAMGHNRLISITTETGEDILVDYEGMGGQAGRAKPLCTASTVPTDLSNNTTECYPVYWIQSGNTSPSLDFFHKYVVTEVDQQDANGTAPNRITTYTYLGAPAWHYDDNEVMKASYRTYGQFRGYQQVQTRTGNTAVNVTNLAADALTLTRTTYFTGMDGDTMPSGTRSVSITDSQGAAHTDSNQYAGQTLETTTFNGDGGPQVGTTISTYSTIATTATRARAGLQALAANIIGQTASTTYANKAAGGLNTTGTSTTYDTLGRPTTVTTSGTGATTSCVSTSYASGSTAGVQDRPSDVTTYSGACGSGTLMRETRTYYDGSTTLGAVTNGDATEVDQAKGYSGSTEQFTKTTNTYDTYGRSTGTTAYDPGLASGNRTTTIAYTPTGTGALTQTVVTNPKNQTTTTLLDPSRGYTTKITDVAGRVTTATHDAMGRVTAVWKPGQVQGTNNATVTYSYLLGPTAPLAVTTKTLVDAGNGTTPGYVTSISIYDAFGGLRQTQADAVGGGRVVSDTFPDSHGWTVKSNTRWYTSGTPTTGLITTTDGSIADRKITLYDGTGRVTQVNDYNGTTQTSTAKTIYGGDRSTTIPPTGGITTTAIVDGEGRQVELDQYKTPPTVSGNVVSNGTYDKETLTLDALGQQTGRTTGGTNATAGNATWTTTFDLLGRPITQVDPDSGTTTSTYFDTGEAATTTDAAGRVLAYDYDTLGRKIGKYSGSLTGTKLAAWTYDTATNGVGQVASSVAYTGAYSYTKTSLGYDSNGNSLGSTLTSTDPALSLESSYPTSQTWTSTNLLATQTLASSSLGRGSTVGISAETLTQWYDNHGDPTGLTGLNAYVSAGVYSAYGELTQYTLGVNNYTAQLTYSRDAQTRRVTDINFSGQTAYPQLEDAAYTYDLAGNPTKITDVQGSSGAPTETQCYSYNGLDQLTQAWSATDSCATNPTSAGSNSTVGGPQPYWTTWGYDDAGNRNTQTQHAVTGGVTADTTTGYTMGDPNHVHALSGTTTTGGASASNSYTYAGDGAMKTSTVAGATSTFNYGPDGQLANIATSGGTSAYVRDADGNILTRTAPDGTTTLYLPGQEIQTTAGNTTVTTNRYYTVGGITVATRINTNNPIYLMSDLHGTNQVATDPTTWTVTRRYMDPFGNPLGAITGGTWPGSHGFIGKPTNQATALTDLGAREYDPTTGRFTSVDPVRDNDPQALNGYAYANSNPLTNSDPTGLRPVGDNGEEIPYCDWHVCSAAAQQAENAAYHHAPVAVSPKKLNEADAALWALTGMAWKMLGEQEIGPQMRGHYAALRYGRNWSEGNVQDAVAEYVGSPGDPNIQITHGRGGGKVIFANTEQNVEVVYDRGGNYYRVFDPMSDEYLMPDGTWSDNAGASASHYRNTGMPYESAWTADREWQAEASLVAQERAQAQILANEQALQEDIARLRTWANAVSDEPAPDEP